MASYPHADSASPRAGGSMGVFSANKGEDIRNETASRACNACRRMKIRCIDKDSPPCKRCRTMNLDCSFDPAQVVASDRDPKSRLDLLEGQMTNVNDKLDGISSLLSRLASHLPGQMQSPNPHHPPLELEARTSSSYISPQMSSPSVQPYVHWAGEGGRDQGRTIDPRVSSMRTGFSGRGSEHADDQNPIDSTHSSDHPGSEDDDPLDAAVRMMPLKTLTHREEAARLRMEGHAGTPPDRGDAGSMHSGSRKRSHGEEGPDGERGDRLVRRKGDLSRSFMDPVQLGYCTEDQGRELFESFFRHSHPFMPVMDPETDTWDDLRPRSAFCTTVILLVASQVADSRKPRSMMTTQCRQAAETMAKVTLFSPVSHFETVQAMVILACWSDVVWRPACHAMTLAVDMDMHRCLPTLFKSNMGAGKTGEALERDRPLVLGARIWLALVKLSYEVAYNHARPIAFLAENNLQLSRELLKHPLAKRSDSRFVVSVEFQACRQHLFRPFDLVIASERPDIEEKVRALNDTIEGLYEYWIAYYNSLGLGADDFLVKELKSQRAYAIVRTNCLLLSGLQNKHDVLLLSEARRDSLRRVIQAAAFLVASIGSGKQSKNSEYGNHYFHLAIISTSRMLIRLVGLMPSACDPKQVGKDIEELISSVPRFPGYSFVSLLKNDLQKARRDGMIPWSHTPSAMPLQLNPDPLSRTQHDELNLPFSWMNTPTGTSPNTAGQGNLGALLDFSSVTSGYPWLDMDYSQSFAPSLALPPVGNDDALLNPGLDVQALLSGAFGSEWMGEQGQGRRRGF